MTSKSGNRPLLLIRVLAVVICLTFATGLVGALTVPAHATPQPTPSFDFSNPSKPVIDPEMPGPGGSKNVPTLAAQAVDAALPNVPRAVPAAWAVQAGAETGIDPRTLLAIVGDESYGGPHGPIADPARRYIDQATHGDGAALGITAVHETTFNEVKAIHPDIFKNVSWSDLSSDDPLALRVLAWKLSDIELGRTPDQDISHPSGFLPDHWNTSYKREQVLALAWNGGIDTAMDYVSGRPVPGKDKLDTYLDHFNASWPEANREIDCSVLYICTLLPIGQDPSKEWTRR